MSKVAKMTHLVCQVSIVIALVLASGALGLHQKEAQQEPPAQEPGPEPYSFSYTADSQGGQSSHQESGDGTGRVTGFYTIRGDDGRERRVDYVADENGYRATVKTNEVGTRSESSADAQYEAELPSQGQLEAANVTYEQYKYLEDVHATARTRAGSRQQQPPQPQPQPQPQQNRQTGRQQQQQQFSNNFSASQQRNSRPTTDQVTASGSESDSYNARPEFPVDRDSRQAMDQQPNFQTGPPSPGEGENSEAVSGYNGAPAAPPAPPASDPSQVRKSWSNSGRPKGSTVLQQQLVQQFMLQANQLSQQDYPRQSQPPASGQKSRSSSSASTMSAPLRQPFWSGTNNDQPPQSMSEQIVPAPEQVENTGEPQSVSAPQVDLNSQPIIQSNVVNESDYSVIMTAEVDQSPPPEVERPAQPAYRPAQQQQQQPQPQPQLATGSIRNTSSRSSSKIPQVPSGLMIINLSEDQEVVTQTDGPQIQVMSQEQKPQPQVFEMAQPQPQMPTIKPTQPIQQQQQQQKQQEFSSQQEFGQNIIDAPEVPQEVPEVPVVGDQQVIQRQPQVSTGDNQRQQEPEIPQEPVQRGPDSIKQIIDTVTRQPVITTSARIDTKQQQFEPAKVNYRPTISVRPTTTITVRPTTTTSTTTTTTTTTAAPTTSKQEETTEEAQVEYTTTTSTTTPAPLRSTPEPKPTSTTTTSTTTSTTARPTTRAPVASVDSMIFGLKQNAGVKGAAKVAPQWMRQRPQTPRASAGAGERRVNQMQYKQPAQRLVIPLPTRRPTQAPIVETTPRSYQEPSTSRVEIRPQTNYEPSTTTTRKPQQSNYGTSSSQYQSQQFQNSTTSTSYTIRPMVGQTKGGRSKKSGGQQQFWLNNRSSQVTYANQGSSESSEMATGNSYFGGRVSPLRATRGGN